MSGTQTYAEDVCNRALSLAGSSYRIGDLQDGTTASTVALQHYTQTVGMLLRATDHEFSRKVATLTATGNAPPFGFTYEYSLPSDWIKVRAVSPLNGTALNPLPTRWSVGTNVVSGVQTTVIWTNVGGASLVYTSNSVTEADWDDIFMEEVVQYLSSTLAPLLGVRDDKGAQSKAGPEGYAQASKIAQLDLDKDS